VRRLLLGLLALVLLGGLGVVAGTFDVGPVVITREEEQKLVLFLREARRVTQPGPSLRWPLVESVETYDRRWLYLNTEPDTIQTRDGEQLTVDNYAVWRISDAIQFRRSFPGGMRDAEKRIDRAVRDDVREVLGRHTLDEAVESKRAEIMAEIANKTRQTLADFGIGMADVRINRTDLPEQTMDSVYARMKTERERLAKKNRAQGEEEARRIRADADRDAQIIVAEANRDADILRGEGDAEAARIYAEAYGGDRDFYDFVRSLEAYRKTIDGKTTLVTSPRNEFFRFLESTSGTRPDGAVSPP
jgi:membrane protease subunit HflC